MFSSNLQGSGQVPKQIYNFCQVQSPQYFNKCQDCGYRHKGICHKSFPYDTRNYINEKSIKIEEKIEHMTIPRLEDPEPAVNLKNLFYEIKVNENTKNSAEFFPQKAKYDNFKLLTDIQRVLQKCQHLTPRDRLNYCNTQRYFMKLYLREINKPE
ncbi:MAG: hypothetical protein ACW98X_03340 [Promethearchaeota archaeon]|jgi:hypothetical protein